MGFMKILFVQCLILAAVHLLMAEDDGLIGPPAYDDENVDEYTTCDSSTQAGTTCASCFQTLTCTNMMGTDVGILHTCQGSFRFCNNGSCSFSRSPNCTK